jgi:hypothetical protein
LWRWVGKGAGPGPGRQAVRENELVALGPNRKFLLRLSMALCDISNVTTNLERSGNTIGLHFGVVSQHPGRQAFVP